MVNMAEMTKSQQDARGIENMKMRKKYAE